MERTQSHSVTNVKFHPSNASEAVDHILHYAVKQGASDIHIGHSVSSHGQMESLLRFRIFGKLKVVQSEFLSQLYKEIVTRLKVMANLNISETQVPQDGQISISVGTHPIELRISTIPSDKIEEVVIRIQNSSLRKYALVEIYMRSEMRNQCKNLLTQKSGLILVSGPAGSGKTTLVYSMLSEIATSEKKTITVEDPVEVHLPFVTHTQISHKSSYAIMARSFLRQNADTIFLGEIRDEESADSAIQLAQTGHLVISTLHTRDSFGVVPRLEALNIHPNFISNTLIGSMNCRLVPQLCASCKKPAQHNEKILGQLNVIMTMPKDTQIFEKGSGCPKCSHGVSGLIHLLELFLPDAEINDMVNRKASRNQIIEYARKHGMRNLAEDGVLKVYNGLIDFEAVKPYLSVV